MHLQAQNYFNGLNLKFTLLNSMGSQTVFMYLKNHKKFLTLYAWTIQ